MANRPRLALLTIALVSIEYVSTTAVGAARGTPCPKIDGAVSIRVVSAQEPGREPALPQDLPLVVRTDDDHHPHLFSVAGEETTLWIPDVACCPQRSPDGELVACLVWNPTRLSSELSLVGWRDRQVRALLPGTTTIGFAWSPDSRKIVCYAKERTSHRCVLYWVSLPRREIRALDSLTVLSDYEFSWNPNSQAVIVMRPISADEYSGDVFRSQLLIVADGGRSFCPLTDVSFAYRNPSWLDASRVLAERVGPDGRSEIVEIDWSDSSKKSK